MDPKALLDELMGKDRDLPLGQKRDTRVRFDDPQVCHFYLVSFCPHDLFPNTKSDLGPCGKIHDETLRDDYLKSNKVAAYEAEFLRYLERLISDLERKIKRSYDRLEKEVPVMDHAPGGSERIANISNDVQLLLKRAEKEGEEGLVDQAQETMARVEILNKEKELLMRTIMPEYGNILEKEKRMQVCEICGAMQASTDTEKRLASHLEGRQHVGYMKIRQMLEQLRKKRGEEQEAKKREREAQMLDAALDEKAIDGLKDSPVRKNGSYPMDRRQDKRVSSERNDRNKRRSGGGDRYYDDRSRDNRDNRYRGRYREENRGRDRRDRDWRGSGGGSRKRSRSRERSRERTPERKRERSRERE